MPLVNRYGERLSRTDLRALLKILQGSLENQIWRWGGRNGQYREVVETIFDKYLKQLPRRISVVNNSPEICKVSQFISEFNAKISEGIKQYYIRCARAGGDVEGLKSTLKDLSGEPALMRFLGRAVMSPDIDENYEKRVHQVNFALKPFPGVEKLGISFSKGDIRRLYRGPSNPLIQTITYYDKHYGEIMAKNPFKALDLRDEAQKAKTYLDVQLKIADCAFDGAARLHDKMKRGGKITFADLYQELSRFNAVGRSGAEDAGKLVGQRAYVGSTDEKKATAIGVAPAVAPKAMINTLDIIARDINYIRTIRDSGLRRTLAIQVAAFAESMVVSMQAFQDGNKRTARMLRDMILMSLGIPPCMPECSSVVSPSIGVPRNDFDRRASAALQSILKCNEALKEIKRMALANKAVSKPYAVRQKDPVNYADVGHAKQQYVGDYAATPEQQNFDNYAAAPLLNGQQYVDNYTAMPGGQQYVDNYTAMPGGQQYLDNYTAAPEQQNFDNYAAAPEQQNFDNYTAAPEQQNFDNYAATPEQQNFDNYTATPLLNGQQQYVDNYAATPVDGQQVPAVYPDFVSHAVGVDTGYVAPVSSPERQGYALSSEDLLKLCGIDPQSSVDQFVQQGQVLPSNEQDPFAKPFSPYAH